MALKVYGFYHLSLIGPWVETLESQLEAVVNSEAYEQTEKIFVSILGPTSTVVDLPAKFEIFNRSVNINTLENNSMENLIEHAADPSFIGYFFHSHGSPYPYTDSSFLVSSSEMLSDMLTDVDARIQVALNFGVNSYQVFSLMGGDQGHQEIFKNWSWFSSEYLNTLPTYTFSSTSYFSSWYGGDSFFDSSSIYYNTQINPLWPDLTLTPYTLPEEEVVEEVAPLYEALKLDYRLEDKDLNYSFYNDKVSYPFSGLTHKYSPYWVRYELGRLQESDNSYYPLGSLFRIPVELGTGTYRPNFLIGHDWNTGQYLIRWKFKKSAVSEIEYIEVKFVITSDGLYDYSEDIIGGYLDLPADLNVID